MLKIGHRGAAGYEPENTLRSFERAVELGVDMVEMDVHVCKSGDVVVIHDDTVDRTTDGTGKVSSLKLRKLKQLNAGLGETIPTLKEALELLKGRAKINIELKGKGTGKAVGFIMDYSIRKEGWKVEDILISSFRRRELAAARRQNPELRLGLLIRSRPWGLGRFIRRVGLWSIHVQGRFVTRRFVRQCHRRGLRVFPWTVNSAKEIRRLKTTGADGIITDLPDRLNE